MARRSRRGSSAESGVLKLPDALQRELVLFVGAKLVLLAILYALFFSPVHRPVIDAVAHIAGALPQR